MQQPPEAFFHLADFVPELRAEFDRQPFNPKKLLQVAVPVKESSGPQFQPPEDFDRTFMGITDGQQVWEWERESLRSLFRGDKKPPVLGDYPEAYNDSFIVLDLHALEISRVLGDRRDAEMREIYSAMRRRPDGRSLGFVHDYMWQAAALVLATRPLSQTEFEAIMGRLERSCRTFEQGPTSRNYAAALRSTLGRA